MNGGNESPQVENVVASSEIDQELDLTVLSDELEPAEFNPEEFPGIIHRMTAPDLTVLIFRSGKIISTGARSIEDVEEGFTRALTELRNLGIEVVRSPEVVIQNIVSSADLGQTINLNAIAVGLGLEKTEYEPEQFPGLIYRLDDPSVVVLLFNSGKVVITGGTEITAEERALVIVSDRLDALGLLDD